MGLVITVVSMISLCVVALLLVLPILYIKRIFTPSTSCTITINQDETLTKQVVAGDSLLATLAKENIALPSPCGGKATCRQCMVHVTQGATAPTPVDCATFSAKQLQQGWRLSCQMKVRNHLALQIEPKILNSQKLTATVVSNFNVASYIKELVVRIDTPMKYVPGSYLQLHVPAYTTCTTDWKEYMDPQFYPEWDKFGLFDIKIDYSHLSEPVCRAYSMASYPAEGCIIKFNIRIATPLIHQGKVSDQPWGICSSYAFSLKPNDSITLSGPYGDSLMKGQAPLIFLIGGAGSSFARSHILDLFHHATQREVDLWYGARSLKENIYQQEYMDLQQRHPNFRYHLVLSEPSSDDIAQGWPKQDPVKTNFLFRAFEQGQLKTMSEPQDYLYYVCGPPLHNQSVLKLLDEYGVSKESIVLDDFGN